MAASVHPFSESRADKSNKPDVVVANVLHLLLNRRTLLNSNAGDHRFLVTSSPAPLG
jgi:hypothetical protein